MTDNPEAAQVALELGLVDMMVTREGNKSLDV